jgi:hypothetical protein
MIRVRTVLAGLLALATGTVALTVPCSAALGAITSQRPQVQLSHSLTNAVQLLGSTPDGTVSCLDNVSILATANYRYVSVELGYGGQDHGMLRARATSDGPWEQFQLCNDNRSGHWYWTLKSLANGRFVSCELDYSGTRRFMLRARADAVNAYERLHFRLLGYGSVNIQCPSGWVSTELDFGGLHHGMLRGRAAAIGEWEYYL